MKAAKHPVVAATSAHESRARSQRTKLSVGGVMGMQIDRAVSMVAVSDGGRVGDGGGVVLVLRGQCKDVKVIVLELQRKWW